MTELDDHELLAEFARSESEAAFAALVARHVNLVYSAARRFGGNPCHAEEITQAVFIILARKAGSLRRGTVLSGWLYQTARLTAANFVKGEIRRRHREQEAYMQSTLKEQDPAAWEQIAPLLDEAMGCLGKTDRNAVVLRFFENKTAHEVGAALKMNEAAAQKRVIRALEKLRSIFNKRGVKLTASVIAGAMAANSVLAAPVGLSATATAAAKGALVSATIANLVSGTIKTMSWLKLKFAVGVGLATLVAGGATVVAISQTNAQVEDDYTTFANYLTNRIWLKEFDAVLNNSRYKPDDLNKATPPELYQGNSTWEASIQPGGFFIKCDGAALHSLMTIGESPTEYWQVSYKRGSMSTASKDPAQGGSEANGRQIIAQTRKQSLVAMLNLGIEGLDNENIAWLSKNQFTSPLLDRRGRPTKGTVEVTIEVSDKNNLPLRLRGNSTDGTDKKQFVINCSYDKPVLPPSKVTVERSVNGVKLPPITNLIRKAVFGLREDGAKGFSPSEFFDGVPSRLIVESNGVRYVSNQGSRIQSIDEVAAAAALEQNRAEGSAGIATSRRTNAIRIAVPSFLALLAVVVFYAVYKRRDFISPKG